jgi:hypothetical protein
MASRDWKGLNIQTFGELMVKIQCELPYVLHGRRSLTELRYALYINVAGYI